MASKKAAAEQPIKALRRSSRIRNKAPKVTIEPVRVQKVAVKKPITKPRVTKTNPIPTSEQELSENTVKKTIWRPPVGNNGWAKLVHESRKFPFGNSETTKVTIDSLLKVPADVVEAYELGLPHESLDTSQQPLSINTKQANVAKMTPALRSPYNRTVAIGGIPINRSPSQSLQHLARFFGVDETTLGAIATHFGVPLASVQLQVAPPKYRPISPRFPVARMTSVMDDLFKKPQREHAEGSALLPRPMLLPPNFPHMDDLSNMPLLKRPRVSAPMLKGLAPLVELDTPELEPNHPVSKSTDSLLKPSAPSLPDAPFRKYRSIESAPSTASLPPIPSPPFPNLSSEISGPWSTTVRSGPGAAPRTSADSAATPMSAPNRRPRFDSPIDALAFEPRSNVLNFNDFKPMPPDLSDSPPSSSKFSNQPDFIRFKKLQPTCISVSDHSPTSAQEAGSPVIVDDSYSPTPTCIPNPFTTTGSSGLSVSSDHVGSESTKQTKISSGKGAQKTAKSGKGPSKKYEGAVPNPANRSRKEGKRPAFVKDPAEVKKEADKILEDAQRNFRKNQHTRPACAHSSMGAAHAHSGMGLAGGIANFVEGMQSLSGVPNLTGTASGIDWSNMTGMPGSSKNQHNVSDTVSIITPNTVHYTVETTHKGPHSYKVHKFTTTDPKKKPKAPKNVPKAREYTPTAPQYTPTAPKNVPRAPEYSPAAPKISLTSPEMSANAPKYSPTSSKYSPGSPQDSPRSPTSSSAWSVESDCGSSEESAHESYKPQQFPEYPNPFLKNRQHSYKF